MTTRIPPRPKRRFLRFTLRSLLLLMLVVCVVLGWSVDRVRQWETVNWVKQSGGSVYYDYQVDDSYRPIPNAERPGPKWLMERPGIDFFDDVVYVSLDTQLSDVSPLAGLKNLRWLYIEGTQVRDMTPLAGLTSLEGLRLDGTQVSDVTPFGFCRLNLLRDFDLELDLRRFARVLPVMRMLHIGKSRGVTLLPNGNTG